MEQQQQQEYSQHSMYWNHCDTTKEDYEHKNHIDIDIPFEEALRQTVVKNLREMRYNESSIKDDNNYEYEEENNETDEEEEMDPAGGAVSHWISCSLINLRPPIFIDWWFYEIYIRTVFKVRTQLHRAGKQLLALGTLLQ